MLKFDPMIASENWARDPVSFYPSVACETATFAVTSAAAALWSSMERIATAIAEKSVAQLFSNLLWFDVASPPRCQSKQGYSGYR